MIRSMSKTHGPPFWLLVMSRDHGSRKSKFLTKKGNDNSFDVQKAWKHRDTRKSSAGPSGKRKSHRLPTVMRLGKLSSPCQDSFSDR